MTATRGAPGHGGAPCASGSTNASSPCSKAPSTPAAPRSRTIPAPTCCAPPWPCSKAGQKLRNASPGASLSFEETELQLLLEAVRFANDEIHWAAAQRDNGAAERKQAVLDAFPELVERGLWRSFGLTRELDDLVQRLDVALRSM